MIVWIPTLVGRSSCYKPWSSDFILGSVAVCVEWAEWGSCPTDERSWLCLWEQLIPKGTVSKRILRWSWPWSFSCALLIVSPVLYSSTWIMGTSRQAQCCWHSVGTAMRMELRGGCWQRWANPACQLTQVLCFANALRPTGVRSMISGPLISGWSFWFFWSRSWDGICVQVLTQGQRLL